MDYTVTARFDRITGKKNISRPSCQELKWFAYWKCSDTMLAVQGSLNDLAISSFGDAIVLAGTNFLSLWSRDDSANHSFTLSLLYG